MVWWAPLGGVPRVCLLAWCGTYVQASGTCVESDPVWIETQQKITELTVPEDFCFCFLSVATRV